MNLESFNFSGKRVLVTGASRGIGLGVARGFANARARLSIIGTNETVHETADHGITMREAQRLIRAFSGVELIGGDVVEVSPPLDPSGMTSLNGATILFEMLS